jgi:hypothetical protein
MLGRAVLIALIGLVASASYQAQEAPPSTEAPAPLAPPRPEKVQTPKGTVSGTIYCADTNQPARLAHISLAPVAMESTGGRSYRADSDLDGRFVISNVPEGKYYVAGELLGYLNPLAQWLEFGKKIKSEEERKALEAHLTTVYVTARQAATVSLQLERGAEISGTVLYDDGSPAVGVHVSLKPKAKGPENADESVPVVVEYMEYAERTTDDRGRFHLLGVAPGEYTVSADLSTATGEHEQNMFVTMIQTSQLGNLSVFFGDTLRASKAKTIKIAGGETRADADITIPLSKLHTVRGRVVVKSTGDAPPTAAVQLLYADTREVARMAMAVDGEFEFGYVADDSYILQATASTEPLPKMDIDDDIADGAVGAMGVFEVAHEEKTGNAVGEVAVLVHGDVSGVVIETPDPMTPKGTTETTAVPSEPGSSPGTVNPQDAPTGPPVTPQ